MKRFVAPALLAMMLAGIGVSVGATMADRGSSMPDLTGKAVIVERGGWHFDVKEDVRFASVGRNAFIVLPSKSHTYWVPLDRIDGLRVFDKLEDAIAFDKRTSPRGQDPNDPVRHRDSDTSGKN